MVLKQIENPSMGMPEEITPTEIQKGDLAINNETAKKAINIINQTDYERETKALVRSAIEAKDLDFIKGTLDDLKLLQSKRDQFKVEVDLDGRTEALQKIYDLMLF